MPELTQERLKELLHYNPETGVFTRKAHKGSGYLPAGTVAGTLLPSGYRQIIVAGTHYYEHRLAWFYIYGYFPEFIVEHRDRVKHHNWISNLRESNQQCNMRNIGNYQHNTSGVKGVRWVKKDKRWRAEINLNGVVMHLGQFRSFSEAVHHRLAAEQCLDWSGCDSCSPAYKYVRDNTRPKENKE